MEGLLRIVLWLAIVGFFAAVWVSIMFISLCLVALERVLA